jgi:RNA polymerase sigma-70 factor, ECF subfamily
MEKRTERSGHRAINKEEFEQLYKRYYPRLCNFARQFTMDSGLAQDMVHEVFMKFWEGRSHIEDIDHGSMLFRMTRNLCLNHVKHVRLVQNKNIDLKNTREWEELYRIEFYKNEPYLLIEQELKEKVEEIMQALPEKCRQVFTMSRIDEQKNTEIARQLGISVKTVEKHISRALRDFRDLLPIAIPVSVIVLIIKNII